MKRSILALALATTVIAGCGDDEQTINRSEVSAGDLSFSYPLAGQAAVPTSAPIFLRFTQEITTPEEELASSLQLKSEHGDIVALTDATLTAENRGIAIQPAQALLPGTRYTLTNTDLKAGSADGLVMLPGGGIEFTTAPATTGPLLGRTEATSFDVARVIPAGDSKYPVTDMSSLRIQFTEPVDEQSLRYGDTIALLDSQDEPVDAQLYVSGHRVTIDPESDLDPAQTYSLYLSEEIRSTLADAPLNLSDDFSLSFQPLDSRSPLGKRERLPQTATTSLGELSLSGESFNTVGLRSLLLGQDTTTTVGGTVFAELGYIPQFEANNQSIPLRIDRGTLLTGSSVEVKVAGAVPAGFSSDEIAVRFLSDAEGFLLPNPYTSDENAPRILELFLDLGLNTENVIANGALAQGLLHVHLIGTAIVEEGALTIDAVGVIEPDVLGVDVASGLISFRLEGYRNPDDAPTAGEFIDLESPFIKSWVPGENGRLQRPSDPVVVYFSKPLLPSSINAESVILYDESTSSRVDASLRLDGSALIIRPTDPLEQGIDYTLSMNGLTDLSGNLLASTTLPFRLEATGDSAPTTVGPIALTTSPGYPCAKTDLDEEAGKQGRCLGGITEETPPSTNFGTRPKDDLLPITEHPANEPIIVRFSQDIDPDTVTAGETFIVQKLLEDGQWKPVTDYSLVLNNGRELHAVPLEKWSTDGTGTYRYELTDGITNKAGAKLYTKLLSQYADPGRSLVDLASGGHSLENRFIAKDIVRQSVFLPLKNLPSRDVNANLALDDQEDKVIDGIPENSMKLAITNIDSGVLENEGKIGCRLDAETCEEFREFIFLTANLDVEVAGEPTLDTDDGTMSVPVKLHPSILLTTSADIWVELSNVILAALATTDRQTDQRFDTGPLALRMRYQGENRDELIDGSIVQRDGQLTFETELDVYLDAPYLNVRLSGLANTRLEDNLRSFPIDGLKLSGPITFLDDGRLVIEQRNVEPIPLPTRLLGEARVSLFEDEAALCNLGAGILTGLICAIVDGILTPVVNSVIQVDTELTIEIAPDELQLKYVSPFTQN